MNITFVFRAALSHIIYLLHSMVRSTYTFLCTGTPLVGLGVALLHRID
jgi:hypothetical protein